MGSGGLHQLTVRACFSRIVREVRNVPRIASAERVSKRRNFGGICRGIGVAKRDMSVIQVDIVCRELLQSEPLTQLTKKNV